MNLFTLPDGKPAKAIPFEDFGPSATGYTLASANEARRTLTEIGNHDLPDTALALIIPNVDQDQLKLDDVLMKKFRPTFITSLPVERGVNEDTRRPDAIMLQCGKHDVKYADTTVVYTLPAGRIVEKLSAQINACDIPAALFAKLESDPHEYVSKAIGADKLEDKKIIRLAGLCSCWRSTTPRSCLLRSKCCTS